MAALETLLHEAGANNVEALEQLGTMYFKGNGVEKNLKKALDFYKNAADRGSGLGNYQIGRAFETGTGAPKDAVKAKVYYKKAADLGYQNAINKLKMLSEQAAEIPVEAPSAPQSVATAYQAPKTPDLNTAAAVGQGGHLASRKKLIAGLLALFVGYFGIHNFYIRNVKKGVIQLVMTCTVALSPIVGLWAWAEAFMIFSGYIGVDGKGIALR